MFWGIKVRESDNNDIEFTLEGDLNLSTITLDLDETSEVLHKSKATKIYVRHNDFEEQCICIMELGRVHQLVNLHFLASDNIVFIVRGPGIAHLNGFYDISDDDQELSSDDDNSRSTVSYSDEEEDNVDIKGKSKDMKDLDTVNSTKTAPTSRS